MNSWRAACQAGSNRAFSLSPKNRKTPEGETSMTPATCARSCGLQEKTLPRHHRTKGPALPSSEKSLGRGSDTGARLSLRTRNPGVLFCTPSGSSHKSSKGESPGEELPASQALELPG